tara:strand:+ start:256 stop:1209 length:954 start_codon:yes stop_codon:yes gene_type:complete
MLKIRYYFVLLLFYGCVEHNFFFHISPNGTYEVHYSAHGDKIDLLDHDFPIPADNKWTIHSTLNEIEVESYDYSANRIFKRNEKFPTSFFNSDSIYLGSLLKHPISIHHSNWFFWETFSFIGRFEGRFIEKKYPLIAQLIEKDSQPEKWIHEALSFLLFETLNQTKMEWNIRPIIESELVKWIEDELHAVNDSILFEELDYYKNLGLDIIMQPSSPNLYSEMDSIFKLLEDELRITLDLDGDDFDFQLILPGILESTNANNIAGDTLSWSFDLTNFMNEDYVMSAKSTINHPDRKKNGLIIFMISCIFIIVKQLRKK